jgi:hypothetical protein
MTATALVSDMLCVERHYCAEISHIRAGKLFGLLKKDLEVCRFHSETRRWEMLFINGCE